MMHAAAGVKDLTGHLVIARWQSPDGSITRSERLSGRNERMSCRENLVSVSSLHDLPPLLCWGVWVPLPGPFRPEPPRDRTLAGLIGAFPGFYPALGELWGFTYSLADGNRESLALGLMWTSRRSTEARCLL